MQLKWTFFGLLAATASCSVTTGPLDLLFRYQSYLVECAAKGAGNTIIGNGIAAEGKPVTLQSFAEQMVPTIKVPNRDANGKRINGSKSYPDWPAVDWSKYSDNGNLSEIYEEIKKIQYKGKQDAPTLFAGLDEATNVKDGLDIEEKIVGILSEAKESLGDVSDNPVYKKLIDYAQRAADARHFERAKAANKMMQFVVKDLGFSFSLPTRTVGAKDPFPEYKVVDLEQSIKDHPELADRVKNIRDGKVAKVGDDASTEQKEGNKLERAYKGMSNYIDKMQNFRTQFGMC